MAKTSVRGKCKCAGNNQRKQCMLAIKFSDNEHCMINSCRNILKLERKITELQAKSRKCEWKPQ